MSELNLSPAEYRKGFRTVTRTAGKDKPEEFYTQHESWAPYEVWATGTSKEAAQRNIQACVDSHIIQQRARLHKPAFKEGQQVLVKHQPDLGICVVTNPYEPSEVRFHKGGKVVWIGYYVRIKSGARTGLGYHPDSLEAYVEPVAPVVAEVPKLSWWHRFLDMFKRKPWVRQPTS